MRKLFLLLMVALGPARLAYSYALLFQDSTSAYNTYVDEYRKWPWRAGVWHTITTLPFHGEHAPPKWVQHDIDVGGSFPIHSASSRGVVSRKELIPPEQGMAGYMVAIQEQDGLQYHVYYLHLAFPGAIPEVDDHVVQGQLIGLSGETGCPGCGAHLHFGMSTGPYSGENISIFPLAGFDDEGDPEHEGDIHLESYPSDNAGIGDACGPPCDETTPLGSTHYESFTQVFQSYGGYDGMGVTWDPCGDGTCWWVHRWDSEPPFTGVVQDFDSPDPTFGAGAIMKGDNLTAVPVFGDFWQKYVSSCGDLPYFDYLGYPTTEQYEFDYLGYHWWWQRFQGGNMYKNNADGEVHVRGPTGEPVGWMCDDPDSDWDGLGDEDEVNFYGTDPNMFDTDGDGCPEGYEVNIGSNPLSPWDVYDVPVPANPDPTPNGERNRVIDIGDVLAVGFYAFADDDGGPNANGVDYDSLKDGDWTGPTVMYPDGSLDDDDAGRRYDRSAGDLPTPHGFDPAGPPNGSVDIGDVLAVVAQAFAIDCPGPPGMLDGSASGPSGHGAALSSAPNAMAVDAVPGGALDSARAVKSGGAFDIDILMTAAGKAYGGYQFALSYDDGVLALLPTADLDSDTTLDSWAYNELDGTALNAEVVQRDRDGDAALDQASGGSALLSGATSATGVIATVRFQCVGDGVSAIHLVVPGEATFGTTTLAEGGGAIDTRLEDAWITCSVD